ncbi:MAG: SLC13 family permease [Magnetococcales bacterium]|nr:SLC13 family permease [Magnetococcales bacterium]NGZ06615.1 SLC13 family permease [Magnetococcales bacterium]
MIWQAWFSLGVIGLCVLLLARNRHPSDAVLLGGVTLLLIAGVLTPKQALAGLANEGMVTVGVLYVVVAGLEETGAVRWISEIVLGQPRSLRHALLRLALPIMVISPFLNNTPVVAMFIPALTTWAARYRLPISALMMPLAFLTTVAGLCTLVGSSTNLVVHGLLLSGGYGMGFSLWEIGAVGLPLTVAVLGYVLFMGPRFLPRRHLAAESFANVREYTVEMIVELHGPLAGKTIRDAGLRHLPGLFLVEIQRGDVLLPAVSSDERLQGEDRLLFTGRVDSVADLRAMPGLKPATDQIFKLDAPDLQRVLVEAVISDSCPLVGRSVREGRFRTIYHAAILAIARNGRKLTGKIGDMVLRPGDQLLLETTPAFLDQYGCNRDFLLIRHIDHYHPVRHRRAPLALGILFCFVLMSTLTRLSTLEAALLSAGGMLLSGCVSSGTARRAVEWPVLLVIAASFSLGIALETTGAARYLAALLIHVVRQDPWISLAMVYAVTALLTQIVTNNATAVLMFPIAMATARDLEVSALPFAVVVLVGASASFLTPIGYQVNLMVQGPGGYRFGDYGRYGALLSLLVGIVTLFMVPRIWPFHL